MDLSTASFEELDGKTLEEFIKDGTAKEIVPILEELTQSTEWQQTLLKIIQESGVKLSEDTTAQIIDTLSNLQFTRQMR